MSKDRVMLEFSGYQEIEALINALKGVDEMGQEWTGGVFSEIDVWANKSGHICVGFRGRDEKKKKEKEDA